jgi:hypothetical protein
METTTTLQSRKTKAQVHLMDDKKIKTKDRLEGEVNTSRPINTCVRAYTSNSLFLTFI